MEKGLNCQNFTHQFGKLHVTQFKGYLIMIISVKKGFWNLSLQKPNGEKKVKLFRQFVNIGLISGLKNHNLAVHSALH